MDEHDKTVEVARLSQEHQKATFVNALGVFDPDLLVLAAAKHTAVGHALDEVMQMLAGRSARYSNFPMWSGTPVWQVALDFQALLEQTVDASYRRVYGPDYFEYHVARHRAK